MMTFLVLELPLGGTERRVPWLSSGRRRQSNQTTVFRELTTLLCAELLMVRDTDRMGKSVIVYPGKCGGKYARGDDYRGASVRIWVK